MDFFLWLFSLAWPGWGGRLGNSRGYVDAPLQPKFCLWPHGPDGAVVPPQGYTPLHIAALHGHRHILALLTGTYGTKSAASRMNQAEAPPLLSGTERS